MSIDRRIAQMPQVTLLLDMSTEYGRGLLRGIFRYSRLHGPWFFSVGHKHLDQVMRKGQSQRRMGIIAPIPSPEMERLIRSTHLPSVASCLSKRGCLAAQNNSGEICINCLAIARLVFSYLVQRGFRSFAFCGFANNQCSSALEKVFIPLASQAGYPCSAQHITVANSMQHPNLIRDLRREQLRLIKWLRSLSKPVGLLACDDSCGGEVLRACKRAELKVPDDVAVVGVGNDNIMCDLSSPPLSSVALDLERAGYEVALLLEQLMSRKSARRRLVRVEPTVIVTRLSSDVIAQEDPLVGEALRFIREHVRQPFKVSDLAREVRVSRRTLERRFAYALGRPLLSEILHCRLQRAKQLLLETHLPCWEIAIAAGFGSLKTFNRNFSQREGTPPHKFRHELRTGKRRLNLNRLSRGIGRIPIK